MKAITILRRFAGCFILLFISLSILAQPSRGFSYQGVLRNADQKPIINTTITVYYSILDADEKLIWKEEHLVRTDAIGSFSQVICNRNSARIAGSAATLEEIDWGSSNHSLKIEIDDGDGTKDMGTKQLMTVPYALYALNGGGSGGEEDLDTDPENEIQDLQLIDNQLSITNNAAATPINLGALQGSLSIQADTDAPEEALFMVSRKDGYPIFAVYEDGVYAYTDTADTDNKGIKGGFAVGGYKKANKGIGDEYMRVNADSIRFYVSQDPDQKGIKGGFAVGGYKKANKGIGDEFIRITPDSVRVYIDDDPEGKGLKGGFAVGGYKKQNKGLGEYFNISGKNSAELIPGENRVVWYPQKNAFLAGNVLIEDPLDVGINSIAVGYQNKASGNYSEAFGYKTIASGDYSMAIGHEAEATSFSSVSIGYQSEATNVESFAFGIRAISDGAGAFAFGSGSHAAGAKSFAIGEASYTGDYGAYALGSNAKAWAIETYAIGAAAQARNTYSTAIGFGAETGSTGWQYATAMGVYNSTSVSNPLLVVGNGSSNSNRSNVLVLQKDGDLGLGVDNPQQRLDVNGNIKTSGIYGRYFSDFPILRDMNNGDVTLSSYGYIKLGYQNTAIITFHTLPAGIGYGSEKMRVHNNGYVGIGTSSPTQRLHVYGNIGYTGSLVPISDQKYKINVNSIVDPLEKLKNIHSVSFEWDKEQYPDMDFPEGTQYGVLAQELETVMPELVNESSNGDLGVRYLELIPWIIESVKEQQKIIEEKDQKIRELEARLNRIEILLSEK